MELQAGLMSTGSLLYMETVFFMTFCEDYIIQKNFFGSPFL